ncbi:MAG: hypothetical protein IPN95_19175 [Bacteroidetes bacterium]|nr:hypothetical protein [Bacteroidota bacterium]
MSKFHAVIGNPRLEQHFIHFVGFKHMHRHTKMYIDPTSQYEPELQGMYYESMRDGAFEDLKLALKKEVDLKPKDSEFKRSLMLRLRTLSQGWEWSSSFGKPRNFSGKWKAVIRSMFRLQLHIFQNLMSRVVQPATARA